MLPRPNFAKKIALVCILITSINLSVTSPAIGCPIFDEYAQQNCVETITTSHLRRVTSCATGAVIRYDIIHTSTVVVNYSRTYCTDGLNWCIHDDAECGPEEQYQEIVDETVCE